MVFEVVFWIFETFEAVLVVVVSLEVSTTASTLEVSVLVALMLKVSMLEISVISDDAGADVCVQPTSNVKINIKASSFFIKIPPKTNIAHKQKLMRVHSSLSIISA